MVSEATISVDLNGLALRVRGDRVDGCRWTVDPADSSVGWWGSPGAEDENVKRPVEHGSWGGYATSNARSIPIGGVIEGSQRADVQRALQRLSAAAAFHDVPLTIVDGAEARTTLVRRDGPALTRWLTPTAVEYSILLIAHDPRLYGVSEYQRIIVPTTADGGLDYPLAYPLSYNQTEPTASHALANVGNADAWPVVDLYGPFEAGVMVLLGGGYVESTGRLLDGQTATIDYLGETLTIDGVDFSHWLRRRDFRPIPPGGSVSVSMTGKSLDQRGWLSVRWRDTWL